MFFVFDQHILNGLSHVPIKKKITDQIWGKDTSVDTNSNGSTVVHLMIFDIYLLKDEPHLQHIFIFSYFRPSIHYYVHYPA